VPPTRPEVGKIQGATVDFIAFPEQEEFIEDLRRAAELCIIGENYVTSVQKQEEREKQREKERWAAARDQISEKEERINQSLEEDAQSENSEKMQLFDLFFEQNGLAMIVDMLQGELFDLNKNNPPEKNTDEGSDDGSRTEIEFEDKILLPPLPIATQALQSISILIQNVSRATSLYGTYSPTIFL
jgi:hypothetical protein